MQICINYNSRLKNKTVKKSSLHSLINETWYSKNTLSQLLIPLSLIYCGIVAIRKTLYSLKILKSTKISVPVIIVGNITAGGTGKTPLVIWLVKYLKENGFNPGVISRGYKGKAKSWPQQVRPDSDPVIVGDEAILISRQAGCPMAVGPDRVSTAEALLKYYNCDIIISDDGLQHYALQRTIEVVVIDGVRRFGNGKCIPAGPLRESTSRLEKADFLVTNGIAAPGEFAMRYSGKTVKNLTNKNELTLSDFKGNTVHAVSAIGNTQRFYDYLRSQGLKVIEHSFPDHYMYNAADLSFDDDLAVIMTEKDAVKCQRYNFENSWYLPIKVEMKKDFGLRLLNKLGDKDG